MKQLTKKQQLKKERVALKRSKGLHTRWKAMAISNKNWLDIVDMLHFADELTTCRCGGNSCRESAKTLLEDAKNVDNWADEFKD
jgi:hypothetical protein